MLFKEKILQKIVEGQVTLAFRRWEKPAVKKGSIIHTSVGLIAIDKISKVAITRIADKDAILAGYESPQHLVEELRSRPAGDFYRMQVSYAGADPRIQLRQTIASSEEDKNLLLQKIASLDRRSTSGKWVKAYLKCLGKHPGLRAADLAKILKTNAPGLKIRVRRLKNLGLTISLGTGYRLSPRGKELLKSL